jgi:SAM-dependent methyltransferase
VADPRVYDTARGPLPHLAEPFARRARGRRHAEFLTLTGATETTRILDVGCGSAGLLGRAPELDVTGVDLAPRPGYAGRLVVGDAADGLPFADDEFDLVYCSSVIEHVPPARRARFAAECRRVARGWYVQTPAASFPIEPHSLLPAAHWVGPVLRRSYWRLGAAGDWEDISLLGRAELESLFGPAIPERFGPLIKSWICVRPPDSAGAGPGQAGDVVAERGEHEKAEQEGGNRAEANHRGR